MARVKTLYEEKIVAYSTLDTLTSDTFYLVRTRP